MKKAEVKLRHIIAFAIVMAFVTVAVGLLIYLTLFNQPLLNELKEVYSKRPIRLGFGLLGLLLCGFWTVYFLRTDRVTRETKVVGSLTFVAGFMFSMVEIYRFFAGESILSSMVFGLGSLAFLLVPILIIWYWLKRWRTSSGGS